MKSIEEYQINDYGYHPFFIRDGWQVAQLNYMPEQEIGNIEKLDIHRSTDEVFILLRGKAVLIWADLKDNDIRFEAELMKPNITYSIPMGTWHNIALRKGCEIIIVEKSDTHIADYEYFPLSKDKQEELEGMVNPLFNLKKEQRNPFIKVVTQ